MALYSVLVACFIGIFVCVSIPHATLRAELGSNPAYTVYAVAAFGLLIGFNTMLTVQFWSRVWYKNDSYVTPWNAVAENLEPLLNPEKIEVTSKRPRGIRTALGPRETSREAASLFEVPLLT